MVIVGYIVMVVGIFLLCLGAVAAAFKVFESRGQGVAAPATDIAGVLKALPEIIKELRSAPLWLALVLTGVFLLFAGAACVQLGNGGWPFAEKDDAASSQLHDTHNESLATAARAALSC
jgi:uncharacterized membrane protein